MDFVVSEDFSASYDRLPEHVAVEIDAAIRRLLKDHSHPWGRQGRVTGELGGAWLVALRVADRNYTLYCDYFEDEDLVLIMLREN